MYSKIARIVHIRAKMKLPKRILPRLYLNNHQYPRQIEKFPRVSSFSVKYQLTTATISTYYEAAMRKAQTQKKKKMDHPMYPFYSSVHTYVE